MTDRIGLNEMDVFQTLSNLGVNYLIPKRITSTEREAIETMEAAGQDVAVENVSVDVEAGSHAMRFLYVPSTKSDGTAVFATNLSVGLEEAVVLSALQPPLADRKRVQIDQERFPREDILEGLPSTTVLFSVRGASLQYLAAHGFPAESGCRRRDELRARVDRR